ncbi:MAG: M48 family metallopeptidase [Tepidimonas sp.]|uniref:M48 family metallopeptidase n=1 Tax=Tepidimonas sp. TaxID=2002775 RepID=UPI00298F2EEF|nr:M48 family metallopeptidase [Tepidimonas sp.]MDW8335617.1 M48 family metallopeptidase [Tepidimonas sp.]
MFTDLPPALLVSTLLAALLLAQLMLRLWLLSRQMRHVARWRAHLPPALDGTVELAAHQRAADYTLARGRLALVEALLQTALVTGWTLLGGLQALHEGLLALLGPGLLQQLALLAAFFAIGALAEAPLVWWRTFRLEQRFGFNRTTLRLWLGDALKGAVLAAGLGLPLAAAVLTLMERGGPSWWLWAWAGWMAVVVTLSMVVPRWIAPWFNRFEPVPDEALRTRLQRLLQRCGLQAEGLYVMDGSRRSAHANAYFTGLGRARRVVLFDTLLQQLSPEQVEAVLAHEIGHARLHHIPRRLALLALGSLVAWAALAWLARQPWFYFGLGVTPDLAGGNAALALLLFLLVLPLVGTWVAPLAAALSRRDELAADAFAARHTSAAALAQALLALHRDNAATLTPDPWYVRFTYSHPPLLQRLQHLQALPRSAPSV